ncbi:MAG: threonine dehydratase [Nostoc sp. ChiSLP02]|nr:threonine dehydratase [Nostoc sp. DedSLP05]MDZ8097977.1 threonine dehydratase [Nostoc sp. DedSLP01]MDZ8187940.1 threonine dehydratase [Nostoc sp. ChiSLP02]
MFTLPQVVRNFFLRLEGFLSLVFKPLFDLVRNFFGFFTKSFGLNSSNYFLESDGAQGIKEADAKEPVQTVQKNTTFETPTFTRRRSNAKKVDDYYINMARNVKNN